MKHRQSRVRELILRELGAIISREMTFTAKLVTVSDVSLTPDFKNCHVHVSVIGTEEEKRRAIQALAERRPLLQHEMSQRVILKYTPYLHFHLDDSIERGSKIVSILSELNVPPAAAESADDVEGDVFTHPALDPAAEKDDADTEEAEDEDEASPPSSPASRRSGDRRRRRPTSRP